MAKFREMIEIALGHFYMNRTAEYLAPVVNVLGKTLVGELNRTEIMAWGLWDALYLDAKSIAELKYHLFILQDPKGEYDTRSYEYISPVISQRNYAGFLKYIRKASFYYDDYPYKPLGKDTVGGHMLVLQIPKEFRTTYNHFLANEFSKMYTEAQLAGEVKIPKKIRNKPNITWQILTKADEYRNVFIKQLEKEYQFTLRWKTQEEYIQWKENTEYDNPNLNPKEEVFNGSKDN